MKTIREKIKKVLSEFDVCKAVLIKIIRKKDYKKNIYCQGCNYYILYTHPSRSDFLRWISSKMVSYLLAEY